MSEQEDILRLIERLFFARKDIFPIQRDGGGYIPINEPISTDIIQMHLDGLITLGAYQLNLENRVSWICFDFDNDDAPRDAQVLLSIIMETEYSKAILLEFSGRKDRRHIWIFFETPVPAVYARTVAKTLLEEANVTAELFPKQIELHADGGYGNLVKLPLGINKKSGKRSTLLFPEHLSDIVPYRVDNEKIEEAELAESLRKQRFASIMRKRAKYCIYNICNMSDDKKSSLVGRRNIVGHALARALRNESPSISEDMLYGAMFIWNQSLPNPLPDFELKDILRKVIQFNYPFGCSTIRENQLTTDFCNPEKCPFGLQFLNEIDAVKWLSNFGTDRVYEWNRKVGEELIGTVVSIKEKEDKTFLQVVVMDKETNRGYRIPIWIESAMLSTDDDDIKLLKTYKFSVELLDGKKFLIVTEHINGK